MSIFITSKNTIVNYDDVINDLKVTLTHAWKTEQDDRNKILKRLILQWHPDNRDDSDLATKVTQFILFASDRLDHGLPLKDSSAGDSSLFYHSYYLSMVRNLSQRATEYRRQQIEYERNYVCNTSHVAEQNFFQSFLTGVNPQPGEGRRWLRQAEMDERAANSDEVVESKAYEWACYKYYQVMLHLTYNCCYRNQVRTPRYICIFRLPDIVISDSIFCLFRQLLSELAECVGNYKAVFYIVSKCHKLWSTNGGK